MNDIRDSLKKVLEQTTVSVRASDLQAMLDQAAQMESEIRNLNIKLASQEVTYQQEVVEAVTERLIAHFEMQRQLRIAEHESDQGDRLVDGETAASAGPDHAPEVRARGRGRVAD